MNKNLSFNNILHVSPYYKLKGGIASVVYNYKTNSKESFKYFYSMYFSNKLLNVLIFPLIIIHYLVLIINPTIKVVHLHCAKKGSFYRKYIFFKIARLFNKKVVFHIHSGEFHLFYLNSNTIIKRMIEKILVESDAVIVLTNDWKEYFSENFIITNIVTVNNIVPFQEKNATIVNHKLHLLFLGRIANRKGIFDLIDSIKKYKDRFKGSIKLFIGGDGEIKKLKKKIIESKLEDEVTYLSWVKGDEKQELLEKCDVVILPSYFEGMPISLLEGMSFGKPIISTRIKGISDILEHNKNGLLINTGDIDSIARAIEYYIDNKNMIKIHGDESYNIVKNYFPEVVFKQLSQLYNSI